VVTVIAESYRQLLKARVMVITKSSGTTAYYGLGLGRVLKVSIKTRFGVRVMVRVNVSSRETEQAYSFNPEAPGFWSFR